MKHQALVLLTIALVLPALLTGCQQAVTDELAHIRAAFLIADSYNNQETRGPLSALERHGASITFIGIEVGDVTSYDSKTVRRVERAIHEACINDFDVLIIPGGYSPGTLRKDPAVLEFVQEFVQAGKLTAAICHGPLVLASADVVAGRKVTSPGGYIVTELKQAGGVWSNEVIITDGNIITGRSRASTRAVSREIVRLLMEQGE